MSQAKALIVEDNAINAMVLKKIVQRVFDPLHVVNDRQAFQALEKGQFSIIFMDINLGSQSMDGEAIMRQLRTDDRFRHLPIFAVTSYAMPGDRERFLEAGFDGYLPKPIRKDQVLSEIQRGMNS
jgi:two-component system, cell cycle response regulator DivK